MSLDQPEPLRQQPIGCRIEPRPRKIQADRVTYVSLNREWLRELGIDEQGSPTVHALSQRAVEVREPAIIIRPAEVVPDV